MTSIQYIVKCAVLALCLYCSLQTADAGTKHKVTCATDHMLIEVEKSDVQSNIYLDNLKYYPEIGCHPIYNEQHKAVFNLSLITFSSCGVTRIINQITVSSCIYTNFQKLFQENPLHYEEINLKISRTDRINSFDSKPLHEGTHSYYHKIIVENKNDLDDREYINVRCLSKSNHRHNITRREVLPAGFSEHEDIEITTTIQNNAPEPTLKVAVKQGTSLVNGELNVKPGTPLTMEIYLDKKSAPIYGLLVSFMRVSDTKSQEETIIFNGCAVDPYLFENFNTDIGDILSAKFRAFKFPETTYVQFTGTVNICLDQCKGVECSNGQTSYGRRKREISGIPYDPKKAFEVTLTTYLKVD